MASVRPIAVLTLLGACGRLGFDDSACALDHDEDGDGVDDRCDVCPQLADPEQRDGDGDGVGDVCDPNPAVAGDELVLFDPFLAARPEWTFQGAHEFVDDALVSDARATQFRADLTGTPRADTYTAIVRLGRGGAAQRQLALYAIEDDSHLYFCDLDQVQPSFFWQITYTLDGASFFAIDSATASGPIADRRLVMTLRVRSP